MLGDLTSAVSDILGWGTDITTDYDVVRDDEGNLLRDEDGKPMRDARDLPPATEPSHLDPNVDVHIHHGREIPAAQNRPDTTYKVTHVDVDADYDFDDTFGQYYAIHRRKGRRDEDRPYYRDISPQYLTNIEQVKRLEEVVDAMKHLFRFDVRVERLGPIAFRLEADGDERDADELRRTIRLNLCRRRTRLDYYGITADETGAVRVWARHIYSYPDWRDLDDEYDYDSEE